MLPDVARAVLTAHAQAPLALDHAYLATLDACDDCKAEVLPLQTAFKSEASKAFFNQLAKDICIRFELFAPHICNGTVDLFTNVRSSRGGGPESACFAGCFAGPGLVALRALGSLPSTTSSSDSPHA